MSAWVCSLGFAYGCACGGWLWVGGAVGVLRCVVSLVALWWFWVVFGGLCFRWISVILVCGGLLA